MERALFTERPGATMVGSSVGGIEEQEGLHEQLAIDLADDQSDLIRYLIGPHLLASPISPACLRWRAASSPPEEGLQMKRIMFLATVALVAFAGVAYAA